MRTVINQLFRLIGTAMPSKRPVERLYRNLIPRLRLDPERTIIRLRDGRRYEVFTDSAAASTDSPDFHLYYFGVWEPRTTRVLRKLINTGDVCVDVGANIGWYTLLLSLLAGDVGAVHAFEPDPRAVERLSRNISLNEWAKNVVINQVALGQRSGSVTLHGSPNSLYSSLFESPSGESTSFQVSMQSLDRYSSDNQISRIDFVKLDVEGSEYSVMKGAADILNTQDTPPVLQWEVNPRTSSRADYHVDDMLEWLRDEFGYHVFQASSMGRIDEVKGLNGLGWSNVFCLVPEVHADRLARVLGRIG